MGEVPQYLQEPDSFWYNVTPAKGIAIHKTSWIHSIILAQFAWKSNKISISEITGFKDRLRVIIIFVIWHTLPQGIK